jgi:hypothetical protein
MPGGAHGNGGSTPEPSSLAGLTTPNVPDAGTVSGVQAVLYPDKFGNANSAYYFDRVADYIGFASVPTTQTSNWTIGAWFEPASLDQLGNIISMGYDDGQSGDGYSFLFSTDNANPGNQLNVVFGGIGVYSGQYSFLSTNQWYHVMITSAYGTTVSYVNGVSTSTNVTTSPQVPTSFRIGSAS